MALIKGMSGSWIALSEESDLHPDTAQDFTCKVAGRSQQLRTEVCENYANSLILIRFVKQLELHREKRTALQTDTAP